MNIYIYILVMAGVTFLVRIIPILLIKKEITNTFVKSFLYYVPYVTLAVMTFPAIINATLSVYSGIAALAAGVIAAYKGLSMFKVAILCCVVVLVMELIIV